MLSDRDIEDALETGELVVEPFRPENIQPASIDLRLSNEFAVLPPPHPVFPSFVDPLSVPTDEMKLIVVKPGTRFTLEPHCFALACTEETVSIGTCLVGILAGKSSLARHGLIIEAAGYCDPGFTGQLTLELFNMHGDRPIMLTPGMLIAQLAVQRLTSPVKHPYGSRRVGSHYQGQTGPTGSRSHLRGDLHATCRRRPSIDHRL